MKKICITLSCLLLLNIAFAGGALRLIIPTLSELSGYSSQEGELAYDSSTSQVMIYRSESYQNLVPTLVEELPTMTDMAGQKLVVNETEDGVEWSDLPKTCFIFETGTMTAQDASGRYVFNTINETLDPSDTSGCSYISLVDSYTFQLPAGTYEMSGLIHWNYSEGSSTLSATSYMWGGLYDETDAKYVGRNAAHWHRAFEVYYFEHGEAPFSGRFVIDSSHIYSLRASFSNKLSVSGGYDGSGRPVINNYIKFVKMK